MRVTETQPIDVKYEQPKVEETTDLVALLTHKKGGPSGGAGS